MTKHAGENLAKLEETASQDRENIDIHRADLFAPAMIARHVLRYKWARQKVASLSWSVLKTIDFACGTGYGSKLLAEVSQLVLGRDKDAASIELAKQRYAGNPRLDFKVRTAEQISKHSPSDVRFDAFVTIETIEHLDEPIEFLKRAAALLRPVPALADMRRGMLVFSTPLASKDRKLRSRFHKFEWTLEEALAALDAAGFEEFNVESILEEFICLTARPKA